MLLVPQLMLRHLMMCRKVTSEHLKAVSNADAEAIIDLILDRAPILNVPSRNRTSSPVPGITSL